LVCLFFLRDLLFAPFGYALRNVEISSKDLGDDRAGVDADGPVAHFLLKLEMQEAHQFELKVADQPHSLILNC
jgi:hypothetical protein